MRFHLFYSSIIVGICAFIYLKHAINNKIKENSLKIITYYICIYFIVDTVSRVFVFNNWKNHIVSHFYFIPQFILLSLFYKSLFNSIQKKIVTFFILLVLSILTIQYIINPKLFTQLNNFEITLTCCVLVVFPIIHLFNSLTKKGRFMYINAGVLFYISFSTLFFILLKLIAFNEDLETLYRPLATINEIFIVLYMIAFLIEYRKNIWIQNKK